VLRRPQSRSDRPQARQDEAYRVLRSNLTVALSDLERPTVAVTSSQPGEGKTATTVNLARTMALAGRRVVLVDLDLRHPDCHRWLGAHNEFGVSDVLLDRRPLDQAMQFMPLGQGPESRQAGFYLLATGPQVRNPAELLGTRRTYDLLDGLSRQADLVLIDTPPVLLVADTLVVSRMTGGIVLVVEPRRTPLAAVQRAKDALTRNQGRILGLVINKYQAKDAPDATYGYGYGYGYGSDDESGAGNGKPA
jgi:capsular exopolysaccharide synthesis family protein